MEDVYVTTYKLFLSKVEKVFDRNNLIIFLNYTKEKIKLHFST